MLEEYLKGGEGPDDSWMNDRVSVRLIPGKGRGYVVGEGGLQTGEVVLVERALLMLDALEEHFACSTPEATNPATMTRFMQALLLRVTQSRRLRMELRNLYCGDTNVPVDDDGELMTECISLILDWLAAVCHFNLFRIEPELCRRRSSEDRQGYRWGLFGRASTFNHSCLETASRYFIGERCVVVARFDLEPGEELTLTYCSPKVSLSRRINSCVWKGFMCTCALCVAEGQIRADDQSKREADCAELQELINRINWAMHQPDVDLDKETASLPALQESLAAYWQQVCLHFKPTDSHTHTPPVDPVSPMILWVQGVLHDRHGREQEVLSRAERAFAQLFALSDFSDASQVALDIAVRLHRDPDRHAEAAHWIERAISTYAATALGSFSPESFLPSPPPSPPLEVLPNQPKVVAQMELVLAHQERVYVRRARAVEWGRRALKIFCLCEPTVAQTVRQLISSMSPEAFQDTWMLGRLLYG
eukprot:Gregarina_sp_Poly_1__1470@NODE_1369_length_4276_cov_189_617486_g917_i0_p2_GENE_NODE_1369_length_4276_cov_189_617486_g917_i0NODE_1369_length_4276_cov_189_617486_g917_i0_p2_ORF_typecomplete_len477_score65_09SET/PF00856_28/9_9e08SET/PF00856_28/2e03_NODE_1369_length_4276_cov_189_617486_g917_i028194249